MTKIKKLTLKQMAQLEAIEELLSHAEPCDFLAKLAEIGFKTEKNISYSVENKAMLLFFKQLTQIDNI